MKISLLFPLCCVLFLMSEVVNAEDENEVKRGLYPFMAFLYYPDETVEELTGKRFQRSAVLFRPDWLITSAIDAIFRNGVPIGFPKKTLLARLGAIAIDVNFTFNEDEDEQEREVIQIVQPKNHTIAQWWHTDISIVKTLLPFNITSAVSTTSLNTKATYVEKTCIILIYARKYANVTEEKVLMQYSVELLPTLNENCGSNFNAETMSCAAEINNKNLYDTNFCQGNSGGPLICDNDVIALQTYIDGNCNAPHLYQDLSPWDNFITCVSEEKCFKEECANICKVTNKDSPSTSSTIKVSTEEIKLNLVSAEPTLTTTTEYATAPSTLAPEESTTSLAPETTTDEEDLVTTTAQPPTEQQISEVDVTVTTTLTLATTGVTATETDNVIQKVNKFPERASWPNERYTEHLKKLEESDDVDDIERNPNLEAQQQDIQVSLKSASQRNQCLIQNFLIILFALEYVI